MPRALQQWAVQRYLATTTPKDGPTPTVLEQQQAVLHQMASRGIGRAWSATHWQQLIDAVPYASPSTESITTTTAPRGNAHSSLDGPAWRPAIASLRRRWAYWSVALRWAPLESGDLWTALHRDLHATIALGEAIQQGPRPVGRGIRDDIDTSLHLLRWNAAGVMTQARLRGDTPADWCGATHPQHLQLLKDLAGPASDPWKEQSSMIEALLGTTHTPAAAATRVLPELLSRLQVTVPLVGSRGTAKVTHRLIAEWTTRIAAQEPAALEAWIEAVGEALPREASEILCYAAGAARSGLVVSEMIPHLHPMHGAEILAEMGTIHDEWKHAGQLIRQQGARTIVRRLLTSPHRGDRERALRVVALAATPTQDPLTAVSHEQAPTDSHEATTPARDAAVGPTDPAAGATSALLSPRHDSARSQHVETTDAAPAPPPIPVAPRRTRR